MDRLCGIGEATKLRGVSVTTVRRWQKEGRLVPKHMTGGHRSYCSTELRFEYFHSAQVERTTIVYARVSSHDRKSI